MNRISIFRYLVVALLVAVVPMTALAQGELKMTGTYQIERGTRQGWIILNLEIPDGSHIYALTQEGSPPPTKIKLAESESFKLLKKFAANKKPHVVEHDPVFEQRVETYEGKVALMAPISIADSADLESMVFDFRFHGQLCNDSGCLPLFNKPVEIEFAGYYEPGEESGKDKKKQEKKEEKGSEGNH